MRLPRQFLIKMARTHELSPDQEDVFLLRFADEKEYKDIVEELGVPSVGACLKRMGQVYIKFGITGDTRGKENKLKRFLTEKYEYGNSSLSNTLKLPVFQGTRSKILIICSDQEPDMSLAVQLNAAISQAGQEVYLVDKNQNLREVQGRLKECDYCLILLSDQCADSELLIDQIREAKELQQTSPEGKPKIVVIRLAFSQDSSINYDLSLLLQEIPQLEWQSPSDTITTIQEVCKLLEDSCPGIPSSSKESTVFNLPQTWESSDGRPLAVAGPYLPEGQVELDSKFYIERPPIEESCCKTVEQPGSLISIKAPHQMGKTSLMARILHYASQREYKTIYLTLQIADKKIFRDLDQFLKWFCVNVGHQLKLENQINTYWDEYLGSKVCCTEYFEEHILKDIAQPIVLGIDDLDLILNNEEISQDFLSLLRTWHEKGKRQALWQKVRLVLAHSMEAHIPMELNQSPFNVGLSIPLPEFTREQVRDLANRYQLNFTNSQIERLINLLGGHPYLMRLALSHLCLKTLSLEEFLKTAPTESGIYAEHLQENFWNIQQNKNLLEAMKKVTTTENPVSLEPKSGSQLASMGLIKWMSNKAEPNCRLYHQYFRNTLNSSDEN